jgi:hypothetical protein
MPASPKPSPSGPSRRGVVRSGAAIAYRQKNYEQRLVKRIRIAGGLALLQGILTALVAFIAKNAGLNPWFVGGAAALTLAAAVGIFFKVRLAGIVVVALTVLNVAGNVMTQAWIGVFLQIAFLLAYVDGMRALFALSRMLAVAPSPEPDVEALQ